jgi:hypothetical protein
MTDRVGYPVRPLSEMPRQQHVPPVCQAREQRYARFRAIVQGEHGVRAPRSQIRSRAAFLKRTTEVGRVTCWGCLWRASCRHGSSCRDGSKPRILSAAVLRRENLVRHAPTVRPRRRLHEATAAVVAPLIEAEYLLVQVGVGVERTRRDIGALAVPAAPGPSRLDILNRRRAASYRGQRLAVRPPLLDRVVVRAIGVRKVGHRFEEARNLRSTFQAYRRAVPYAWPFSASGI